MKLRARTEFDFKSTLKPEELVRRTQEFLDRFRETHPDLVHAKAFAAEETRELRLELVLLPMSYGAAEDFVLGLGGQLVKHLESCQSTEVEERGIELVPA